MKVDTAGVDANPTSNCSSPSSDKENSEKDDNTGKKWVPPKVNFTNGLQFKRVNYKNFVISLLNPMV